MALNTILKVLKNVEGTLQRVEIHPKTSASRVWISGEGSSATYLNTKLTDIDTAISGKAPINHAHEGDEVYVWSEQAGDTLDIWASSINTTLAGLAGGLKYKGSFTDLDSLKTFLNGTRTEGDFSVCNAATYTIPDTIDSKTVEILYGDDGGQGGKVIEKNDYVIFHDKSSTKYQISILNNTHGVATTSAHGIVQLATKDSTENDRVITTKVFSQKRAGYGTVGTVQLALSSETTGTNVITAETLTSKLSGYARTDTLNNFSALNNFNKGIEVSKTLTNVQGSDDYMKFSVGDQAFAKFQIDSGNPELRQRSNFRLQGLAPNSPSDTAHIIHQYNIKTYMGMNYFTTSNQENNFTQENVIYAVADPLT